MMARLKPMRTFDPICRCTVHDTVNDMVFQWKPERAEHYRLYATNESDGVIAGMGSYWMDGLTCGLLADGHGFAFGVGLNPIERSGNRHQGASVLRRRDPC
jgi:hypothetical protein